MNIPSKVFVDIQNYEPMCIKWAINVRVNLSCKDRSQLCGFREKKWSHMMIFNNIDAVLLNRVVICKTFNMPWKILDFWNWGGLVWGSNILANICLYKVNNRNTREKNQNVQSQQERRRSGVYIVNFDHISKIFPVFLVLTLNRWTFDGILAQTMQW